MFHHRLNAVRKFEKQKPFEICVNNCVKVKLCMFNNLREREVPGGLMCVPIFL